MLCRLTRSALVLCNRKLYGAEAESSERPEVAFPLPYTIPAVKYTSSDRVWICDKAGYPADRFGRDRAQGPSFYGVEDSDCD